MSRQNGRKDNIMNKIINGKKYSTDTATLIGIYDNKLPCGDFYHYYEELYKKRTGEFFLYGSGGAGSKYSRSCGQNSYCGSDEIIPLSNAEAMEWAENHLEYDDYVKAIGEVEE